MAEDKKEKRKRKRTEEPPEEVEDEPQVEVKKAKKSQKELTVSPEDLSPLAHPLAEGKLLRRLYKTVKRASKARQVKRGVKEVVKAIRKGEKGLLVLAADIDPIDIISHLPVLSEEAQIPYVFVSSKEQLGLSSATKRPTSCVMVCPDQKRKSKRKEGETATEDDEDADYRKLYTESYAEVEKLNVQYSY